jgi:hypothetical protein
MAFFQAAALSVWTKVQGALNTVINEIPDDEIQIMHDGLAQFSADLTAGKSWGDAAADLWTFVENQEGKELSKVANLLLQAFVAKLEPPAA